MLKPRWPWSNQPHFMTFIAKKPTEEELNNIMELDAQTDSWTICEVLRCIWKEAEGSPNESKIKSLVAEATVYAKRMAKKLRTYKEGYEKEIFPKKRSDIID